MQLPTDTDISSGTKNSVGRSDFVRSGKMTPLVPCFKVIGDELVRVEKVIDEQLSAGADGIGIDRLLASFNKGSGKLLRPSLVLLSYLAVRGVSGKKSGQSADSSVPYKVVSVAAVMEMIHNATLLHDDVIDQGQRRRGQPTVNSLWGNESAVLLGDFLLSRVFRMCAELGPEVAGIISAAAARTCQGELRQMVQRKNWQLSESEYIEIITEKSAVLFGGCCHLGGLLAGAEQRQVRQLTDFGLNTGIAFQIADDLLDIVGREGKTGKTLGSDIDTDKLTLPVLHLLRTVDGKHKSAVTGKLIAEPARRQELLKMLGSSGSLEYTRSRVGQFVAKAIGVLNELEKSSAKAALLETAEFIGHRID